MKRFFGVVLGVAVLGGALACGPSFQAIYEGNARFEHCYALEENAPTSMSDKADCWRDWSEHYTYGQTRDRIHYATARYVALSQSSNVPTDEAMMMAAPGMTPRQSTITAPAPTNAFAPPPKVLEDYGDASSKALRPSEVPVVMGIDAGSLDAGGAGGGAGPGSLAGLVAPRPIAPLPASECGDGCGTKFRDCNLACAASAGEAGPRAAAAKDAGCTQCEPSYRGCMRGCFK